MKGLKFTRYSENLFNKFGVLRFLHRIRLRIVGKYIRKFAKKSLLEVGCYDLHALSYFLKKEFIQKKHQITALDTFSKGLNEKDTQKICLHNADILKKQGYHLAVMDKTIEEYIDTEKYDVVYVMETIERVIDEPVAFENIARVLKKRGHLIISVPIEKYLLFGFKELGRRILFPSRENSTLEEMFFGLIGMTSKIKRVPRAHKGYDYKNTIEYAKKAGLSLIKKRSYPTGIPLFDYGIVIVFKKN